MAVGTYTAEVFNVFLQEHSFSFIFFYTYQILFAQWCIGCIEADLFAIQLFISEPGHVWNKERNDILKEDFLRIRILPTVNV